MRNSVWMISVFFVTLSISGVVEAKLFKWVDDKGVTHYGEVIPPEYAGKDKQILKKSGLIEKQEEAPDPAEIKAKQEMNEKRRHEKEAELELKRRNATLLNTYSNEKEIDQAKDRSLVLINARIDSNKMLLKSAQDSLADLNKELESRTRTKKAIPASLTNDIKQTEARISRYSAELEKSEADVKDVNEKFDNDKTLYRQLKGMPPAGKK